MTNKYSVSAFNYYKVFNPKQSNKLAFGNLDDIADAFKKIGYKDKLELFEQLFLETIQRAKP